jgi:hypothetical protein
MKNIYLFFLLLLSSNLVFSQSVKYQQIIVAVTPETFPALSAAGIPSDDGYFNKKENTFTTAASESELALLRQQGINFEIEIEDLEAYYAARNAGFSTDDAMQQALRAPSDYPVPFGFELGSCGGFSTIDQCYAHLDNMRSLYPNLITVKEPVSDLITHEGRTMYYVKISDNPEENEDEPQVLYTGMHHAREPIGMQHLLFYMYYILDKYETDAAIRDLIDNTEMFFIPILNVDGYMQNITSNPNGGGMWRKNKRINSGSVGVDLNRNYGFAWGWDNEGSSPSPSSETYRGPSAFSEPETQMIKEFCESHNFKVALNYHSYSNLLLYAWGYIPETTPDELIYSEYSKRMTIDNHYTYGPGSTTIYPSNGGSDDWMYGEQDTKEKILAYTPEVGSNGDGFWPSTTRIIPLCQENMIQSLMAARFSGTYGEIKDKTPMIIPEKESFISFNLTRMGQTPANYSVSIEPLGDAFLAVGEPLTFNDMDILQTITDSISFELGANVNNGDTLRYVLTLDNGYYFTRDTIEKYYGTPVIIFEDDFPNVNNWSGQWGLYSLFPYSPPYSIADSPTGNYANNSTTSFTLNENIDLTHASVAVLNYYARWGIEAGYDYVQISISTNNGSTWTPLQGLYTKAGSSNQAVGQPLYDGIQSAWVREEINLSPWAGQEIKLRFRLRTDAGATADGFFFDDIKLTIIDITTSLENHADVLTSALIGPWPNPVMETAGFQYQLTTPGATLVVTDLSGKEIMRQTLSGTSGRQSISTSGLSSGLYLCKIMQHNKELSTVKMIKH